MLKRPVKKEREDIFTLEILRHRLWVCNDEQGKIAIRISGSPIVYDANDFCASLMDAEGGSLFIGAHVTRLAISVSAITKWIIENYKQNPGINDGDMFMTNDPWVGAAHHNDFALIQPVFWEEEIISWTGIAMHEGDVGGPLVGSAVKDAFDDPPIIAPVKVVEGGKIRKDVENVIMRNSRTRELNELDLRARIAAQIKTREAIHGMVKDYGLKTFLRAQGWIKESVKRAFTRRLRELPDGTWREEGFLDHNGIENKMHRFVLQMTKKDEKLVFDFRGTEKQALGAVNCAPPGLTGGIFSAILPMMCYDMPWCPAGLERELEIISEPGTLNNAHYPAAVGIATISAIYITGLLVRSCIAKMYAASDKYREEVQANWNMGPPPWRAVGLNKEGRWVKRLSLLESRGAGALSYRDGMDSAGSPGSPSMSIPNVENAEYSYPLLLILYRKQQPDTAGPGKFRGGVGMETAVIPYECEGALRVSTYSQGFNHPEPKGVYGGFPPSVQAALILRKSNIDKLFKDSYIPLSLHEISCAEITKMEAKSAGTEFPKGDVLISWCMGGAGYGDPLERELSLIQRDYDEGLVTLETSRNVYGTVIDKENGKIEASATEELRKSLKEQRIKESRPVVAQVCERNLKRGLEKGVKKITDLADSMKIVKVDHDQFIMCSRCSDYLYGPVEEDPKKGALVREVPMERLSPLNRFGFNKGEVVIREFCCPKCGTSMNVEIRKKDDPILFDTRLERIMSREESTGALKQINKARSYSGRN